MPNPGVFIRVSIGLIKLDGSLHLIFVRWTPDQKTASPFLTIYGMDIKLINENKKVYEQVA